MERGLTRIRRETRYNVGSVTGQGWRWVATISILCLSRSALLNPLPIPPTPSDNKSQLTVALFEAKQDVEL